MAAGLLVVAAGLALRLNFTLASLWRLSYPYFLGSSEGLIVSEAAILRAGGSIYVPFQADSFISAPYPPLYYYLVAWWWNEAAPFEPGRYISLAAALGTAAAIALGVGWAAVPGAALKRPARWLAWAAGGVAGLLFLTLPAVSLWAARVRPDMLMTCWQTAGLALLVNWRRTGRGWTAWAAIGCFTLALYTKQTALAGPAAGLAGLAFYYGRRWRPALRWALALALAAGLPFLLLNWLTGLELYRRLFKYHDLPWRWENFQVYFSLFIRENAGLLLAGAGLLLLAGWRAARRLKDRNTALIDRALAAGRELGFAEWYLLASLALLGGLGVSGADHNHFLPAQAALCLASGTLAVKLLAIERWRWLLGPALGALLAQAFFFSVPPARYEIEFRAIGPDYRRQVGRIVAYAASKPGALLSNEAGFYVLAGKAGQRPYYNDLFTLAALDRQGLYSREGLIERVRRKEFDLVLAPGNLFTRGLRPDVWTPELVEALEQNYNLKFSDVWFSYEPKP